MSNHTLIDIKHKFVKINERDKNRYTYNKTNKSVTRKNIFIGVYISLVKYRKQHKTNLKKQQCLYLVSYVYIIVLTFLLRKNIKFRYKKKETIIIYIKKKKNALS